MIAGTVAGAASLLLVVLGVLLLHKKGFLGGKSSTYKGSSSKFTICSCCFMLLLDSGFDRKNNSRRIQEKFINQYLTIWYQDMHLCV